MAASNQINDRIAEIIIQYVPLNRMRQMLAELEHVEGNKSFKATIRRVVKQLTGIDSP